ncbi:hypothetical protein [Candidatus Frankia nodulisporulans]|uniref:hypothetical protein n=1 Tax=Candidatus Frankia nodulisporulans TaxID=2060052 RepID=UPI0037037AC8
MALWPATFGRWARGYTWAAPDGRQVHRSPVVTASPASLRGAVCAVRRPGPRAGRPPPPPAGAERRTGTSSTG